MAAQPTSPATALAIRASSQISEALPYSDGGSLLADIDPQYYAIVVKAFMAAKAPLMPTAITVSHSASFPYRQKHSKQTSDQ